MSNSSQTETPEQGTTPRSYTPWRDLLAFGLSTVESLDVDVWSISCSAGDTLSVHLNRDNVGEARRVAAALGIDESDAVEHYTDTTYSIGSRGPAPFYYKDPEPYPYSGASVPFGDRLVQITVVCGLPAQPAATVDDEVAR